MHLIFFSFSLFFFLILHKYYILHIYNANVTRKRVFYIYIYIYHKKNYPFTYRITFIFDQRSTFRPSVLKLCSLELVSRKKLSFLSLFAFIHPYHNYHRQPSCCRKIQQRVYKCKHGTRSSSHG